MPDIKPCTKFLNAMPREQMKHIAEEFQEVADQFYYIWQFPSDPKPLGYDEAIAQLAEEIVDLQTACETMLAIMKVDVDVARRRVIDKNMARGYYNE